jgi:DNA repair photolyase
MNRRHIEYEPLAAKTILNSVKAPSMPFEWSINPYRGCQHGCSFCYARKTHTFLGVEANDHFQNHIYLKTDAADVLEAQVRKLVSKKGPKGAGRVAIGTATDPYQPIEAKAQSTRQCLEVLRKYGLSVSITTRSPLILRDLDLLRQMDHVSVNISLNTLNHPIWKAMEPSTPSPEKRLETIKKLTDAGIRTGVFMAPMLPLLTDDIHGMVELVNTIHAQGAAFVIPSYLRLNSFEVKSWFFHVLEEKYPRLVSPYADLYARSAYLPKTYTEPRLKAFHELIASYDWPPEPEETIESPVIKEALPQASCEPVQLSFF